MSEIVLVVLGAALALVSLPVALRMRIDRPLPGVAVAMRADASLLLGLVGVAVTGPGSWRLGPTIGKRSLPGISFRLRTRSETGPRGEPVRGHQGRGGAQKAVDPAPERTARERGRAQSKRLRRVPMQPALGLLRALPRSINLRRLRVDARVGLGDPAKTGYLFGVVQGLEAGLLQRRKQLQVRLEPDFREQVLCGRLEICMHLSVTRLAAYLLRFGLEVGGRRLSERMRSARWLPFRPGRRPS